MPALPAGPDPIRGPGPAGPAATPPEPSVGEAPGRIVVEQQGKVLVGRIYGSVHAELVPGMVIDLAELVNRADSTPSVRAVVLTGAHTNRFLGPASVPMMRTREAAGGADLDLFRQTLLDMNRSGAVFVAALNGSALGSGCELALACDYRVMADGPFMVGQPEILLGLIPGAGGTQRLPRLMGTASALIHILDGEPMTPAEALSAGILNQVVPSATLLERALEQANHLGSRDKATIAAAKRCVYVGASTELTEGLRLERLESRRRTASRRAQHLLAAYQARTETQHDLPFHRPQVYAEACRAGFMPSSDHETSAPQS